MEQLPADLEIIIPEQLRKRYTDFKFVGQGGMGRIISAMDTMLNKPVAIKILPSTTVGDAAVIRFHQEAKAVSKLNHPNVVQVLDFDFASSGEPYLVMEFVKGQTLESLIDERNVLPLRLVISLAIQICSALQHAHGNGIVHRDLKPGNIMLDEDNNVRVLDFGLAKIMEQSNVDWRVTKPGVAMGSPLYMSPEQLRGEEVDERTDIFSLGLVMYKMATGAVPLEGENIMKILVGRFSQAPPVLPPNDENPLLGEALAEVIVNALQIDRDDRTASMTELKDELLAMADIADPRKEPVFDEHHGYIHRIVTIKRSFTTRKLVMAVGGGLSAIALVIGLWTVSDRFHPVKLPVHNDELDFDTHGKSSDEVVPGFFISRDDGWLTATSQAIDDDLKLLKGRSVENLNLQANKHITVKAIKTISTLPIKCLRLRATSLGNEIIPYINKMKLASLDLRDTDVNDAGVEALLPSDTLKELSLGELKGVSDHCLPHVARSFPKLDSLVLSDTKVTGNGLKLLKPLRLRSLALSVLKLTDKDMDAIVLLRPVSITLEMNPITDKGLDKLLALPVIKYLSVANCHNITNKKLDEFRRKYKLQIQEPFPMKEQIDNSAELLREPEPI